MDRGYATKHAQEIKRIIFIASYPPRQCGIATFTQDLIAGIRLLMPSVECSVCVMHESDDPRDYPPEVIFQIKQDNKLSYIKAAAAINLNAKGTIVVVQHEYGIYGGEWGKYLLTFLKLLRCPVISTMHTIVAEPTKKIRQVTEGIIKKVTFSSHSRIVRSSYFCLSTPLLLKKLWS